MSVCTYSKPKKRDLSVKEPEVVYSVTREPKAPAEQPAPVRKRNWIPPLTKDSFYPDMETVLRQITNL